MFVFCIQWLWHFLLSFYMCYKTIYQKTIDHKQFRLTKDWKGHTNWIIKSIICCKAVSEENLLFCSMNCCIMYVSLTFTNVYGIKLFLCFHLSYIGKVAQLQKPTLHKTTFLSKYHFYMRRVLLMLSWFSFPP